MQVVWYGMQVVWYGTQVVRYAVSPTCFTTATIIHTPREDKPHKAVMSTLRAVPV